MAWEAKASLGLGFGLTAAKGLQEKLSVFQQILQTMNTNCLNKTDIPVVQRRMSQQVVSLRSINGDERAFLRLMRAVLCPYADVLTGGVHQLTGGGKGGGG